MMIVCDRKDILSAASVQEFSQMYHIPVDIGIIFELDILGMREFPSEVDLIFL